ncbi:MAG: hypothetical protein Q8930_01220 [Bacillota bacterium]|nr:hypothetical protein [Bacillota bacterium]
MQNKGNVFERTESKDDSILEEEIFIGESDEIVPNCEGGPCNYVYRGKPEE